MRLFDAQGGSRSRANEGAPGARRHRERRGRVFVISSPSGGGKTTVVDCLLRERPVLVRSVSVTTRLPRAGERQRCDYHFVSPASFQRLKRSGQLLEWAKVHGAFYGTPRHPVERALARGRNVILSIDVQGAGQVRRVLGEQAVLVFLLPPSLAHLRKRLAKRRTDTPSAIRRRMTAARRELACAAWYDYTVVNDQLDRAVREVRAIVTGRAIALKGRRPAQARPPRAAELAGQRKGSGAHGAGAD